MRNLNLGCGEVYFDNWINIDLDSKKADINMDLRQPLPYESDSVDMIYSEHVIEHFNWKEAESLLKECYRVLKPSGVIRIATPDLDYLVFKYFFFWKHQDWIKTYGYSWMKNRAQMLNIALHEWGHQYVYNYEELEYRLRKTGFTKIARVKWNKSKYNELRNRETRKDSKLVIEAAK